MEIAMSLDQLVLIASALVLSAASGVFAGEADRLTPVPFTHVHIDDAFWAPRLETNRETTVRYCFEKCEETGRIDNFAKAAGLEEGPFIGRRYDDSDVYKVIEGAAYSLAVKRDPKLEAYLDGLIAKIAGAQEDDGYLYTTRTIDPKNPAPNAGDGRWSYVAQSHELYNVGHMYEAAVAYYEATGKRSLLDVAIKSADLIDRTFGPGKRQDPPGHEEIEIGLVKLYRVTGEKKYLDLAKFFIERRGRAEGREKLYGWYSQDNKPVEEQAEPEGHAVRAMYLYSGMADVAAATGDEGYIKTLDRIWESMVSTRLALTGGVGARASGEAFGDAYELPNQSAYNETCAAVGNALWNERMGLLHRDGKYFDVLERVLYNGFLSGVSLSGDRFFYPNPLASGGTYERSPWFDCSCCPVNVVRFVPSIAGYVFAHDDDGVYVNLYVGCKGEIDLGGNHVTITQKTEYPWDGRVDISVEASRGGRFPLHLRVPGWAQGRPVPSDLYTYTDGGSGSTSEGGFSLSVNGERISTPPIEHGYVTCARTWQPGDVVTIDFDMPVHRVRANAKVADDRGLLAFERGPIVYCLEAIDNGGHVRNLWIPEDGSHKVEREPGLLGGVTTIGGKAFALRKDNDGRVESVPVTFKAVPYEAWANRGTGEMAVWIPTKADLAEALPDPTLASRSKASTSHCWSTDSPMAVNDQREPGSSGDGTIPRLTWWDHKGTTEWVQLDFPEASDVSWMEVYWFDDTGVGECRVPESWRVLVRDGGAWRPVQTKTTPGVALNRFNRVEFDGVKTDAVRLEAKLQIDYSGGVLEWRVGNNE
ncbi:MAG: glycoside hydrolase family 127 protein [Phycisphaeraceae bacterium]|nr:MAG: glycoside hydrolase family 127 protein [Phycisphaeraceae bacterium]